MMTIDWRLYEFRELRTDMLYQIMAARQEVFVVEQNCAYQDADGYDAQALHLCGFWQGNLVAYARLFAPGRKYPEASIGRVLTLKSIRRQGAGKQLMTEAFAYCRQLFPGASIRISAQSYLETFYSELGFKSVSEQYLEDGIPHQEMLRYE